MRLVIALALVACGDNRAAPRDAAPDPSIDAPADPFAGRFASPADFPRDRCTPGSLAAFAYAGYYPEANLRTTFDGTLHTFLAQYVGDVEVVPVHTADDLLVRMTAQYGAQWQLVAFDACSADADGTLRGSIVYCIDAVPCTPQPIAVSPLHRVAGEAEGLHLARLGEHGWPGVRASNVRVAGDIAYVTTFEDGLRVVSIADPAAPVDLGHLVVTGDFAGDLKLVDATHIVTASSRGNVIDVADPAHPQLVAQLPVSPHTVFVEGTRAYFATATSGDITVFDLADPTAPVKLGTWTAPGVAIYHDVYVTGGIVYASDASGHGIDVIDMRDPANPVALGSEHSTGSRYWHTPWQTTVAGAPIVLDVDEGTGSGLRVLDGGLHALAEWHLRDRVSIHNIMAIGSRVYAVHYRDGVRMLDLATPAAPVQLGYYNTWIEGTGTASFWTGAHGIDLDPARKRIYVADTIRGLVILQGDATAFP